MGHKFTPEEAKAAQARGVNLKKKALKVAANSDLMAFVSAITGDLKDIVVELIRATQANPLVGITVTLVTADVLYRAKIIGPTTVKVLFGIVGTAAGLDLTKEAVDIIEGVVLPFLGNGNATNTDSIIKPTPTTFTPVNAESSKGSQQTGNAAVDGMVAAALGNLIKVAAA